MTRIIRFTGKSESICDLIYEFEKNLEGKNLIIDTIVGQRKLPIKYKVEDQIVYDFYDYLNGDINLYKATVEVEDTLDLISSSYIEGKENFDPERLENFISELVEYDNVLINSNEYFNNLAMENVDNIIIGKEKLDGQNYFISDKKVDSRIYAESNLDCKKAFDNYFNKEEYKPTLAQKFKELFN